MELRSWERILMAAIAAGAVSLFMWVGLTRRAPDGVTRPERRPEAPPRAEEPQPDIVECGLRSYDTEDARAEAPSESAYSDRVLILLRHALQQPELTAPQREQVQRLIRNLEARHF